MIEDIFTGLTHAISAWFAIALIAALGWGVISVVLSPCHLSSIPLVIGYLTNQGEEGTRHPYRLSSLFAVGILTTVAVIGAITALLGRMIGDIGRGGNYIVGGCSLPLACTYWIFCPCDGDRFFLVQPLQGVGAVLLFSACSLASVWARVHLHSWHLFSPPYLV
jgi:hypothetical protein